MVRRLHRLIIAGASLVVFVALSAVSAAGPPGGATHPIVFGSNRADGARDLYVVTEDGSGEHRLTFDGDQYFERVASWSPDGTKIAYAARHAGNFDIYTIDADGQNRVQLTTDPRRDDYPEWTSDGRILFTRNLFAGPTTEWVVNADGTGERQLPLNGSVNSAEAAPDGDRIAYAADDGGVSSLHVAKLGKDGKIIGDRRITGNAGDFEPHWSPDGTLIVFLRDTTGVDNDIYVVRADGTGLRQITSTPSRIEFWATWSSDGREILFQDNNTGKLRAISLASGEERAVATSPRAPLTDSFGDGFRDSSVWHQINDAGGSIGETGGRLVATISGAAVPGGAFNQVDEHFGSMCSLTGDFDYSVNYELLQWPHLGGFRANLAAFFANGSVGRASVPIPWAPAWGDEQVQGYSDGGGGQFVSAATSGTFRLVRRAGIVYGFVAAGTDWRPVFSGAASGDTVYGVGLSTAAADFGHLDGAVAFDDFTLTSGGLSCPDWWQDSFSDVMY